MAKQIGDIIITGTIDDIIFYEMEGKGYPRKKTSLTGKRVKKDPRFKRSMQSANRFGKGNQLASKLYRSLPREEQVYALFKELKRIAILAIKDGKGEEEVMMLLRQRAKKNQGVKTVSAVTTPLPEPGKAGPIKKMPRLFRVPGGSGNKVRGQRVKGKGPWRRMQLSRTGQREYLQKE